MSKIGLKPIKFSKATISCDNGKLFIKGPKGEFEHELSKGLNTKLEDGKVVVYVDLPKGELASREQRMSWGTNRALISNKVKGVEEGFTSLINIVGLGYKALVQGNEMVFSLGYSHKINKQIPSGISVTTDKTGQKITVESSDKLKLGNFCADVKALRPVEPYKGTGIFLDGEKILRKAGKSTKS